MKELRKNVNKSYTITTAEHYLEDMKCFCYRGEDSLNVFIKNKNKTLHGLEEISHNACGYANHLILLKITENFTECDFLCIVGNTENIIFYH